MGDERIRLECKRCFEHYNPDVDDPKILEGLRNMRRFMHYARISSLPKDAKGVVRE